MRCSINRISQVGGIIPQHIDTHVHARRDHVPQIPLAQQNAFTMKLVDSPANPRRGARNSRRAITINVYVGTLKVRAEKDRARRYETALGLARDIRRYLNDEPIEASPPSSVYRMKKFARSSMEIYQTVHSSQSYRSRWLCMNSRCDKSKELPSHTGVSSGLFG